MPPLTPLDGKPEGESGVASRRACCIDIPFEFEFPVALFIVVPFRVADEGDIGLPSAEIRCGWWPLPFEREFRCCCSLRCSFFRKFAAAEDFLCFGTVVVGDIKGSVCKFDREA